MDIKKAVLKQLAVSEGEYISGAALARNMDVSRNAVWKTVKSLENDLILRERAIFASHIDACELLVDNSTSANI